MGFDVDRSSLLVLFFILVHSFGSVLGFSVSLDIVTPFSHPSLDHYVWKGVRIAFSHQRSYTLFRRYRWRRIVLDRRLTWVKTPRRTLITFLYRDTSSSGSDERRDLAIKTIEETYSGIFSPRS